IPQGITERHRPKRSSTLTSGNRGNGLVAAPACTNSGSASPGSNPGGPATSWRRDACQLRPFLVPRSRDLEDDPDASRVELRVDHLGLQGSPFECLHDVLELPVGNLDRPGQADDPEHILCLALVELL